MEFVEIVGWIGTALLMLAWLFPAGSNRFMSFCLLSNIVWIWFGIMSPNTNSLIFINSWMFVRGVKQLGKKFEIAPPTDEELDELVDEIEKERRKL